jgi:hypothetical protein
MPVPKRKLLSGFLLLLLSLVGAAFFRRRRGVRGEQVDLYYADGTMVTLTAGSPAGDGLLEIARDVLREVRA